MLKLNDLIIISAGELGREVYTWALQAIHAGASWTIKGFLDDRTDILRNYKYNVPIIGSPNKYVPEPNDRFLCAIGSPAGKKRFSMMIHNKGGKYATLIHPSSVIGLNVNIGAGSIIGPLTQLSCDISIGQHVFFGTNSNTGHDTVIGDYCQISGSCEINGHAVLGEGVFLGSHSTILPKVKIGAYAFIGAGSVVIKKVAQKIKVFGNPAIPIGQNDITS